MRAMKLRSTHSVECIGQSGVAIEQLRGSRGAIHMNEALVISYFSRYTQEKALRNATECRRHT